MLALQHVLPPIDTSQTLPRSGTQELDDILGAYGDSPTKPRFPDRTDSSVTTSTVDQVDHMPVLGASTSGVPAPHREPLRISTRSNNASSASRPKNQPRSKSNGDLDLIDRLDISGLYGGGGFVRHEGPYAAASGSRSPGGHAPIDAFDPSAFSLAVPKRPSPGPAASSSSSLSASTSSRRQRPSNGLSERAHSTLGAASSLRANDGPYGAATRSASATHEPVSMGFPGAQVDGKSAQLMEIYGIRDAEAWEDYGTARYDPAQSAAASRESMMPAGTSKEDRMQRTQSIWDIEATLKAGKPVGSAPPPVPVIPSEWSAPDVSPNNKPKRSKSLAARFRAGRRNPNSPLAADDSAGSGDDASRSVPTSPTEDRRGARELPLVAPPQHPHPHPSQIGLADGGEGHEPLQMERLADRTAAIRFDESTGLERSTGMTRTASAPDEGERKKSGGGLKRLFSTKRKG
ncbi:hypothetical protein JCM8097_000151 [Rhodosporidiobolus ruineniae]